MKKVIALVMVFVMWGLLSVSLVHANESEDNVYYTRVNIWYENPAKIFSTNYHVGTMIPVGTKVKVLEKGSGNITFHDYTNGIAYTIVHMKKHSPITPIQLFDNYFSKDNILKSKEYNDLSKEEKEYIAAGTVVYGMSKEAVLMAYGYPPQHRTPSTQNNTWVYWRNRFRNFSVEFVDNKVTVTG